MKRTIENIVLCVVVALLDASCICSIEEEASAHQRTSGLHKTFDIIATYRKLSNKIRIVVTNREPHPVLLYINSLGHEFIPTSIEQLENDLESGRIYQTGDVAELWAKRIIVLCPHELPDGLYAPGASFSFDIPFERFSGCLDPNGDLLVKLNLQIAHVYDFKKIADLDGFINGFSDQEITVVEIK